MIFTTPSAPKRSPKKPIPGCDVRALAEGDRVTLSESVDDDLHMSIWTVLAVNEAHIALQWSGVGPKPQGVGRLIVVETCDRQFYLANVMADAIARAEKEAPPPMQVTVEMGMDTDEIWRHLAGDIRILGRRG